MLKLVSFTNKISSNVINTMNNNRFSFKFLANIINNEKYIASSICPNSNSKITIHLLFI